jgi:hypothetical protein
MCTMSWQRDRTGYDLFFNRDEKRARLPAQPPEVRRVGSTRVLAPRDGQAGGSWMAANEHGLTLALLNGYLGPDAASAPVGGQWTSRGQLVVELAACSGVAELTERIKAQDLASFRSFHLAAIDPHDAVLASWREGALECAPEDGFSSPLISSSFEFAAVAQSRLDVYREYVNVSANNRTAAMLAYHRSHRPDRGAFSTCMHRDDARTVSFSWVRVDDRQVRMRYSPDAPCRGWPPGPALSIDRSEPRALPLAGR